MSARRRFAIVSGYRRSTPRSWQRLAERPHRHFAIDACRTIGIGIRPLLRGIEIIELGDDQTAAETRGTWIFRIDRGEWTGQQQPAFFEQPLQAGEVRRPRDLARVQRIFDIDAGDGVPHGWVSKSE